MHTPVYLQQPALVSAIGRGTNEHLTALFANNTPTFLSPNDTLIAGKTRYFGHVAGSLRAFSPDLPHTHRSRNNQLLWDALAQIEDQVQAACTQYGKHRVAVVIGTSTTGADENIPLFQNATQTGDWGAVPFLQAQQAMSAPADFVRTVYDLDNVAYSISTACTSGARALMSAARLLHLGVCDAVICGGVDTLSPLTVHGFHSLEVLSHTIARPFSAHRDGINIGEAAAVFVMTREPNAGSVALLGYGASADAHHMSSPHPEGAGAILALQAALSHAKVSAADIGWINLHGTGTTLNDSMESHAVHHIFGDATPCTSTKPLTGHTLGAAGALEAAIVWLITQRDHNPNGRLPAHWFDGVYDDTLPRITLTHTNSHWQTGRRIAISSSFAFGGNNSVLVMGEVA